MLKFLNFIDILYFFPKYPSAEDKKEKTPNINSQTSTKTTLIIIEEQKTVEEAISGDEEPSAVGTSLRLAKGKMKTVSC